MKVKEEIKECSSQKKNCIQIFRDKNFEFCLNFLTNIDSNTDTFCDQNTKGNTKLYIEANFESYTESNTDNNTEANIDDITETCITNSKFWY